MTKAERIYDATKREIRRDVYNGFRYDALGRFVTEESVCQRTVNAVRKLWERDCRRLEQRNRLDAMLGIEVDADKARRRSETVETLRRMGLTIGGQQRRLDARRDYLAGRIGFDEWLAVDM